MDISKDYGCDLLKKLLEENKGQTIKNYEPNKYVTAFRMIVAGKLKFDPKKIESIHKGFKYYGCNRMLFKLYKKVYKYIIENEQNKVKKCTLNEIKANNNYLLNYSLKYVDLPEEDLETIVNHKNFKDWSNLCSNKYIKESFWRKYIEKLNWHLLSSNPSLSLTFIEEFKDKISWHSLVYNKNLPGEFWYKNQDQITEYMWMTLCENPNLDDQFYEKFIKTKHFTDICRHANFTEEFLENHLSDLDWDNLCVNDNIKQSFFEKHIDMVNWCNISFNKNLTEEFITKHIDNFDIDDIETLTSNGNLTEEFWTNHIEEVKLFENDGIYHLCDNKNLSEKFYSLIIDKKLYWLELSKHPKISKEFLLKNAKYVNWSEVWTMLNDNEKQNRVYDSDDPRNCVNLFDIKFRIKHKKYYSFDEDWKKFVGVL